VGQKIGGSGGGDECRVFNTFCTPHGGGVSPAPHGPFSRAMGVSHHAHELGRPGVCGCHRPCCPSHLSRVSIAQLPRSITDCALHGGGVSPAPHSPLSSNIGVSHHARKPGCPGVCRCHRACCPPHHSRVSNCFSHPAPDFAL